MDCNSSSNAILVSKHKKASLIFASPSTSILHKHTTNNHLFYIDQALLNNFQRSETKSSWNDSVVIAVISLRTTAHTPYKNLRATSAGAVFRAILSIDIFRAIAAGGTTSETLFTHTHPRAIIYLKVHTDIKD